MKSKQVERLRRATKTRAKIRQLGVQRLSIFRTPLHIYAQVTDAAGERVVACASTTEADIKKSLAYGGNISAAAAVGEEVAKRAIAAGVKKVAFDRSGYRYHGRVKALADAAREQGLNF